MAGIKIDFGANTTPFNQAMAGVKNSISNLASSLGGKLGAALGFSGLVYSANRYIDKLDKIADDSRKLGVSTDFFQKLNYAAERSGTSIDVVESAIKRLSRNIYDLGTGGKGAETLQHNFAALGITFDDFKSKNPEEQFLTVSNALNKITDATEKSALAQKIFGKSGAELILMLKDYNSLATEIESKGLIKESTIKAADQLSDNFTDIKTSLAVIISQSGVFEVMAKGMNDLVNGIYEAKAARKQLTENRATGEYTSKAANFGKNLSNFLTFGYAEKFTNLIPRSMLYLPAPNATDKEKFQLQKSEVDKKKAADARLSQVRANELNHRSGNEETTSKEQQILEKKILEEETNLKILRAQNSMNEYQFGLFKIIAETDKKIKEAKDSQLKKIYAQQGALEIANYEKKYADANKERTISIREQIELSKARSKVDRKEISEREYEIYQARMQEAFDIRNAQKEHASSELIDAIKEKTNLDIQSIISKRDESMPIRGLFGGSGVAQGNTEVTRANKLQERSLEYQKQAAESLKEIERKSVSARYV